MPQPSNNSASRWTPPREQHDWGAALLTSPWLWGAALTVGFYQMIPHLAESKSFFDRYFCAHWIQYAETAGFFTAVAMLLKKSVGLSAEQNALNVFSLDQLQFEPHVASTARATAIAQTASTAPPALLRTQWLKRIVHVCEFALTRRSTEGLEEHLRYRADLAQESHAASFALLRSVTWAIPMLGCLGTVIGVTAAFADVTFDSSNLGESLDPIVAGLALACDPLTLGLALSFLVWCGTQIVERAESDLFSRIEELAVARLAPLLPAAPDVATPLAAAETEAADHLLERTESLVNWQTGLWQSALEDLRNRWVESAESQQNRFRESLQQGMETTLAGHGQELQAVRGEFLSGFRTVAEELRRVVAALQTSSTAAQSQFGEQVAATWRKLDSHLDSVESQHQSVVADSARLLSDSISTWHGDLERATHAMKSQLAELREQSQLLRSLSEQTGELEQLQSTLTRNLQSVRALDAFEETIQSLNVAIHLLTSRSKGLSAAA